MSDYTEHIRQPVNMLKAVFWDYPQFTDEGYLREALRENEYGFMFKWILSRFLERARVVETFKYFSIETIATHLSSLRLPPSTRKKWLLLIEVYGRN